MMDIEGFLSRSVLLRGKSVELPGNLILRKVTVQSPVNVQKHRICTFTSEGASIRRE